MKNRTKKLLIVLLSLALSLSLLAIVASASASASNQNDAQDGKKINVWLIAGQSNAVGFGETANYPDGYSDGDILQSGISNVLYYGKGEGNNITDFVPVTFGLGRSGTHSGAEIGIATALSESGEQHVIIKYASGDTQLSATKVAADNNISTWTPPSYVAAHPEIIFDGDKIGDLYDGFISTVNEAVAKLKADGYTPVVQGLWWMQGERDSNYGTMTADLYSTLLKTLISDVRRDVGMITGEDLSDMPAVFGRIYCNPANEPLSATGLAAVQAAQDAVSLDQNLKNVAMLDTRYDLTDPDSGEAKAPVQQDKWHYDTLTQQMIGEAFVRKAYALKDTQDETDKSVYIEGYGTIPADRADANTYPVVLFQNGELKGVYAKSDFKAAYKAAHDLTVSANAPAAKILLRGDAEFEGTAYADKLGSSFSEIDINLGGNTLTHTGTSFIFYLRMLSHTASGETFTLNIRNGNIASANYVLFGVGAMYNGTDASVKLTNLDINMTDVNVKISDNKGWNTGPIFINQGTTNNADDKEMKIDLAMTDCTLDLSGMKKASTIFDTSTNHVAEDGSKIHAFNIEINGGEIILGSGTENVRPYASNLYTLNDYSSITFGKGTDGEYLKLTVPANVTATILTKTPFYTDKPITGAGSAGTEAEFVNPVATGDWITYSLQSDVYIEGYGTIPKEYSNSNTHPIVLFQGGEFKGAYLENEFKESLVAARTLVDYNKGGAAKAQILLGGNATMATADDQNMGRSTGEIEINLNGFTLTQSHTDFLFSIAVKDYSATKQTFTLTVKNGTVLLNGIMFGLGAQSGVSSSDLNDAVINVDNVNFLLKNTGTPNAGPVFGVANKGSGNLSGDIDVEYDFNFTDCTFDFSDLGKANYIFNASQVTDEKLIVTMNIHFNGGELIVGKGNNSGTAPYNSALYTLNDYSSIIFGKGSDGNYLNLTVPTDVTSSIVNSKITLDTGAECVFVKRSEVDRKATYQVYPEVMLGYKIKSSVTLYSNFIYNIYIPATNAVSAVYINGESITLDESMIAVIDESEYYRIQVSLPASKTLNDIKVVVSLASGETTVNVKWTLNIVKYAKTVIAGDSSDVEKALICDMLSYAASAHTYFNTSEAVADKLAEIANILGESYDTNNKVTVPEDAAKQPADATYFKSVSIYLGEVPSFRFYLANGYEAGDFTFTVSGKRVEAIAIDTNGDGISDCVEIVIYAYMMLDDVSYTVVNKDTNAAVTEYYNLYAYYKYVSSLTGDASDPKLVSIVERLMKYAESAKVYRAYVTNYHEHSFDLTVKAEATAFTKGVIEHKCSSCGYAYTEVIPTRLKILAVGNSFSTDAMEHLYLVAKNAGIENVVLGNLYIGSCSISTHWTKMNNDAADYTFYVSDDTVGGMITEGTRTAKYGITYADWDYITIQQSSSNSGLGNTYNDLQSVIDYINSNKTSDAEILWHMTWAYQQDSTHAGFANYNNNQSSMYKSIVSAVKEHILTNSDISGVIPSGTAIQNLRTSPLGDTLTRDGYHMSYGIGRYTVALTWLAAITGYDIDEITATPTSYPEVAENVDYIKEAVRGALENPYSVTRANVEWEMGTIASKDGMNSDTNPTNRMRTVEYLSLSDIKSVAANAGYTLLWFAYDKDMNWLGKLSTWASEGAIIKTADIVNAYPSAVYFRLAMKKADGSAMTFDKDLVNSGVAFTYYDHNYINGVCKCGDINVVWGMGTIASKDGMNSDTNNTNRMRTVEYLSLSGISSVTANAGYTMLWFAYDKDMNWVGKLGTWASEGAIINTADIVNSYPSAVYFRLAMKKADGSAMTFNKDLANSGVAFVAAKTQTPEENHLELEYERLINIGACQDGAIWNETLFALNSKGTGTVYDLKSLAQIGKFTLDGSDVLKPHANSVCFGNTYYEDGDKYPLLYVSVYNNYQSSSDRMEGTCCVYRITELDGSFTTQLVQVIRIGFTEDPTLWKSIADNGDVRPYGNFFVDTDNDKFYAYVMRDSDKTTRFFGFDIPELSDGVYNDTYGCNLVTLEKTDIKRQFDTVYINYMQGVTYTNGVVISAEGFEYGDSRGNPVLRIIDLSTEAVVATYYLENYNLKGEPEIVSIDFSTNKLYYASLDGELLVLEISNV